MGSTAFPMNFPIRNRIIRGMSVGWLVVEGAQYNRGRLVQRLGNHGAAGGRSGREVFAVPGNITSKMSWLPNLLIKQGAS